MSKVDAERTKAESRGLRGSIAAELEEATPRFSDDAAQLLKFHGTYQQEDRDARKAARETGGAQKAYGFMIRIKATAGRIPAELWRAVDDLSDRHGNSTIRITTRQALQLHGIRKSDLRATIADVVAHLGSTQGTCGDVVRNVVAPPWPLNRPEYAATRAVARELAAEFAWRSGGYLEVWQDGEVVHTLEPADEPIYGTTYLPRKFKIAVTVAGDNSVDVYTNDVGLVAIADDAGRVLGYDVLAGGGLGRTHGKTTTYPRLASALGFVAPDRVVDIVRAMVLVQRDFGDRTDRRHARLKYLIDERGAAWFRAEVERVAGFAFDPWRELPDWDDVPRFGWHAQGDGRWFFGIHVANGRVRDDGGVQLKAALRALAERGFDFNATLAQQLLIVDVAGDDRSLVDAVLREHNVAPAAGISPIRRTALACPALPTCGLSLAEAERAISGLLDQIEAELESVGLEDEPIAVRMTGCPNGCARPYMAEIGIVGQSPDRYQLFLGGHRAGTRLAQPWRDRVHIADIPGELRPVFAAFAAARRDGESFGDWCARDVLDAVPA
ncbi:MAG: NADPH-dependent assimilatory sulfite reductase hemoprotein subunit [Candidatus Elarobacter sp.]